VGQEWVKSGSRPSVGPTGGFMPFAIPNYVLSVPGAGQLLEWTPSVRQPVNTLLAIR